MSHSPLCTLVGFFVGFALCRNGILSISACSAVAIVLLLSFIAMAYTTHIGMASSAIARSLARARVLAKAEALWLISAGDGYDISHRIRVEVFPQMAEPGDRVS